MQVGRAQPEAVERHVGVAVRLAEMLKALRVAGVERCLVRQRVVRIRIEPAAVGADVRDRSDLADLLAARSPRPMRPWQLGAIASCRCARPALRPCRSIGSGTAAAWSSAAILSTRSMRREIERRRRRAGTECSALVTLLDRRVVAVPVKLHASCAALGSRWRGSPRPQPSCVGQLVHREVEQHLGRIEGVDAAGPPV